MNLMEMCHMTFFFMMEMYPCVYVCTWRMSSFLVLFSFVFHLAVEQSEHIKDLKKNEASRGVEYFQDRLGLYFTKQKGD
jgi:hypothetical protein